MNIYVGNLSYETSEGDLKNTFERFGNVSSARVITDKYTGKSKGFGFVEMANTAEARQAIQELNDREMDGRRVTVNEAKPREDSGDRRGGGGGGGGGRSRW